MNIFKKWSSWGIALFVMVIFVVSASLFKRKTSEGFQTSQKFLFKTGTDVYDDFYANLYDYLVFNETKNDYEIGEIVNKTTPDEHSVILDIGCGTGHHVSSLANDNLNVLGIDISPSMVEKARKNYPKLKFEVADAQDGAIFQPNTFTHILCMYFTIYYFRDKQAFFNNCFYWLHNGGYLVVHAVDRDNFDPILPPGNPLLLVSPQRYSKERITSTKVKFDDFDYEADFKLDAPNNSAKFVEKFIGDGNARKHEHVMFMESESDIVTDAQNAGFIVDSKIDLIQAAYEYQYLYVFQKPL